MISVHPRARALSRYFALTNLKLRRRRRSKSVRAKSVFFSEESCVSWRNPEYFKLPIVFVGKLKLLGVF